MSEIMMPGRPPTQLSAISFDQVSKAIGVSEVAILRAFTFVEAGLRGFYRSGHMKMLYEPHIAYRELKNEPKLRARMVKEGLAYRRWGEKKYPKASGSRRRLARAVALCGARAYRWASYGLGQTMGFNAKPCGFPNAGAMVAEYLKGEPQQLMGMGNFLKARKVVPKLNRKDWAGAARIYNGAGYARHGYHTRLAQAYKRFKPNPYVGLPGNGSAAQQGEWADGKLAFGDMGPSVRHLQRYLRSLGFYDNEIDGHFGRGTMVAVKLLQKSRGARQDGFFSKSAYGALVEPFIKAQVAKSKARRAAPKSRPVPRPNWQANSPKAPFEGLAQAPQRPAPPPASPKRPWWRRWWRR